MKQTITGILFYCFVLNLGIYGQTIEQYKNFNAKNTSGQVLGLISSEYSSNDNTKQQFRTLVTDRTNEYLPDYQATEKYLKDTGNIIITTRNQQQYNLLLLKTGGELIKYGVGVATNFADLLPSKMTTKFITPAIERAAELLPNKFVDDQIEADQTRINGIVKNRITLLYTKNSELDFAELTNQI